MTAALAVGAAEAGGAGAAAGEAGGAGAAGRGAGGTRKAGARKRGGSFSSQQVKKASSPITEDMSPEQVEEELQHRRKVAAATGGPPLADDQADEQAEELVSSRSSGRSWSAPQPVSSGSGFVLGVLVWAVVVNFLHGGPDQVKALLRAKFLNQTAAS